MMNAFAVAGWTAGWCNYGMLRIWGVTGLIHDLVEGAAKGRGGLQPSNYIMHMSLSKMHIAAAFLICHTCIYRSAVV